MIRSKLASYWNGKPLGLFKCCKELTIVILNLMIEKTSSLFWRFNFKSCGRHVLIQKGTSIRRPGNISLGNSVSIGRYVKVYTEFPDSQLIINDDSQVNQSVELDYSGGVEIGKNVVISDNSVIMSHDHGIDPKSKPCKRPKRIEDNVWIASNCIILPQASVIGQNSVVAAGSVVTKDVPKNVIVAGNPAKIIRHLE